MNNDSNSIRSIGLKLTKQRQAIIDILRNSNKCLSAVDIYNILLSRNHSYGLTTIYRTLEVLEKNQRVRKIDLGLNEYYYQYLTQTHFHNFVCLACKDIKKLNHCPISNDINSLLDNEQYIVTNHKLELYGYCPNCK